MTDIVAWDKDSTLANTQHRKWLADKVLRGEAAWGEWSAACTADTPIEASRELMYLLAPHYEQHVLSGSDDCPEGRKWLVDHRFPYSECRFRQPGDCTPNGLLKARWINELQGKGHRVRMYFEDYIDAAEIIERETGVPVMVVNPRYLDHAPETKL